MTRVGRKITLILAILSLTGCGGGSLLNGGNGGGGGGGGGTTITPAQRMQVLEAISVQYTSLMNTDPTTSNAQIGTYLKSRSEFEASGLAPDGSAWARFKDGRLLICPPPRKPASNPAALVPPPARTASRSVDQPSDMPFDGPAYITNAMGPLFVDTAPVYRNWFEFRKYTSDAGSAVPNLKRVQGVGVFYIDCHFGEGESRSSNLEPAAWTEDRVYLETDVEYDTDIKAENLVYMCAAVDRDPVSKEQKLEWHYAITSKFVQSYMSFAPKSFVYIDGCGSYNTKFMNACFGQGASLYVGWSKPVDDGKAVNADNFLFDRLLSINNYLPEDPPQRAFDWRSVWQEMVKESMDLGNEAGDCHIMMTPHPSDDSPFGLFVPSIAFMSVKPYDKELYIFGIFGDNPGNQGQVTINGTPLTIKSWQYSGQAGMDMITAEIPYEGAASYGDVKVIVRKHESNVRQLSIYRGHFVFTHDTGDGRKWEIDHYLRFRVDLQSLRAKPGQTPIFAQNAGPNPQRVFADQMSFADYKASGAAILPDGTIAWSGSDTLLNNIDGSSNPRGFIASAWFDPANKKVRLSLSGSVQNGLTQIITDSHGNVSTQTTTIIYGIDDFDGKTADAPSYVEFTMNPDYSMPKTSRNATKVWTQYTGTDIVKIAWDPIQCTSAPKADTARSIHLAQASKIRLQSAR